MSKEEKRKKPSAPSVRTLSSYWRDTVTVLCRSCHFHTLQGFSMLRQNWDSKASCRKTHRSYHSMTNIFSLPVRSVPDIIMFIQPQRSSLDRDQPRGHRFLTCVPVRLFLQQMRAYLCLCNGGSGAWVGWEGCIKNNLRPFVV